MELASYILGKKSGGGETPTGTINITKNGITNVSSYASADVNVQPNLETKSITITENTTTTLTPTSGKDGMSSVSITTDVSGGGGLDWSAIGYDGIPIEIVNAYNYALQIKEEWTKPTSMANKFSHNTHLVYMPLVEINPNATNMSGMFYGCADLQVVPKLDTKNITNMSNMFCRCVALIDIPQFDTSKVSTIEGMFKDAENLETVPLLDCSSVVHCINAFNGCSGLKNVGGLKDIGKAYLTTVSENYTEYMVDFSNSRELTHDSLMNIINNVYDIASAGVQTQTLKLGSRNTPKLTTEEIAIATNKGWNVI